MQPRFARGDAYRCATTCASISLPGCQPETWPRMLERVDFLPGLPQIPLLTSTERTRGMRVPRPTGRSEHQIRSIHPDAAIDDSNAESIQSTRRRSE